MAKSSMDKSFSLVLVFAFFVLLHHSLCLASSKSNEEAEVLLKWKASLQFKNQSRLTSWTYSPNNATSLEPCTWLGISCEDGSVSRISLAYSGIAGTLREFPFSSFHNLAYLNLSSNQLHGPIPPQMSHLTKLSSLDLSNNGLSGNIPPEIGLLTHLEVRRLGYNRLNGSIAYEFPFSSLRNLTYLYLSSNELHGSLPSQISELTNLIDLDLSNNKLSGNIPPEIGLLTHLECLGLGYNRLNGSITLEIGKLKSLKELSFNSNNLGGPIPTSLGNLSNMTNLDLSNNSLNGSIPSSPGKLKSLDHMLLNDNRLSGFIPPEFGSITHLSVLDLSSNNFSNSIPKELGNLSGLQYLSLMNNQLSQEIPITLMNLHELFLLYLSNNLLIGHIPPSISDLKYEYLNLSHNRLSGGIPRGFNNMPRLSIVDLSYNNLQGRIPYRKVYQYEAFQGNKRLCGTLLLVFAVTAIFIIIRRRKKDPQAEESNAYDKCLSWISSAFDGRIMYEDIIKATNDFNATYRIGRGGFGIVYKAQLPSAGIVATKKFHSPADGEHAFQKEFLNEIKALLEIKHRNVVKLHGFCSNARHSFLVYEYLEGGSLASHLRREETAKELDWSKRLNIVKGVARALCYLHHDCLPPIVHRDISSSNVLLDSKFEAHVSDFGTAKLLKTDSSNWSKIAGTYGYIAPVEVIKGEHPGDIIESLLSTRAEQNMVVKDVLDHRLPPPSLAVKYEIKYSSENIKLTSTYALSAQSSPLVMASLKSILDQALIKSMLATVSNPEDALIIQLLQVSAGGFSWNTNFIREEQDWEVVTFTNIWSLVYSAKINLCWKILAAFPTPTPTPSPTHHRAFSAFQDLPRLTVLKHV
ncbi:probable leucine-rich repeat receptor-like protein kinase At1g35710 [Tripterygium wilfordii]|uniref:probable leucine-rich repeat receptor-like protein kinase At1g35710 n=1 Tax=Tripterygium wilfordii TaxID=458696 RepID=UPI0018F8213A|nr:probable leucine-rich repeat receptor-like protein kinase At1g35710 [Tripterygium wilfordii]